MNEGDWVSFYQNGRLVISEVRYVIRQKYGLGFDYYTDLGIIDDERIIEVRTKNEPAKTY